jgi:hypothetical protein
MHAKILDSSGHHDPQMTPLETTVWKRMAVFLVVLTLMIFPPA